MPNLVAFDATPREPMPGRRDLLRGTLSEFVAMTLFVFFGCGAAASNAHFSDGDWDPASVTVIALQFGLTITVLVYATAHTSGGHINAAVTLGLTVSGKCHPIRGASYFIAQMLGSVAGAAILKGATHGDAGGEDLDRSGSLGSNGLQNASVNLHNAVAFEFVGELSSLMHAVLRLNSWRIGHAGIVPLGTFLLMYTVLETAVNGQSLCTDGEPSPPSPVGLAGGRSAVESRDEKAARLGESSILGNKLSIAPLPIGTPSSGRPHSHKGFSTLSRVPPPRPSIGLAVFIAHVVRAPVAARKQEW